MHNSVLQVSSNKNNTLGTAFVIECNDNGCYVATCGHVVNDCDGSVLIEGIEANVTSNKHEQGVDLAVLFVNGLKLKPFNISNQSNTEKAHVIGYSYLSDQPKREPINDIAIRHNILLKTPNKIDAIKLFPNESISYGYSGSPVICQVTEKVIGVVNMQVGDDTNYAICAKHIGQLHEVAIDLPPHKTASTIKTKKGLKTMVNSKNDAVIKSQLKERLDESLRSFSSQPLVWIEPVLHTKAEDSNELSQIDYKSSLNEIIENPTSLIIQARQQYGLSSIAHSLALKAWEYKTPSFWLYIDANNIKPYRQEIEKYVSSILSDMGLTYDDIECVILDGFSNQIEKGSKLLEVLSQYFSELPLIVMLTIDDTPLLNEAISLPQDRSFTFLNLWALPRNDIRSIVREYNQVKLIGEEDKVVAKVVSDLSALNIPRTPLNCLTLLKISEIDFDDDPVNRTEMINRVLFLLFNVDDIPNYKVKPDVKDVQFVLGYFCEKMIRDKSYTFTHQNFINDLNKFCTSTLIDLNVSLIFDVLYNNNIIIEKQNTFVFRFSYWVFYFAAHRMHHSEDFFNFIMKNKNYSSYPEIVEFYTGTDRKRDNVLTILIDDIRETCSNVDTKCGLPNEFNLYNDAKWLPTDEQIEEMNREVSEGVKSSNLPDTIKDQYKDKSYDRRRPLDQTIHTILGEYSLLSLMRCIKAGSKALRNSDYASVDNKKELLDAITQSWEQLSKVILVLSPALATNQVASLEGASFRLNGDFGSTPDERISNIIPLIPTNVVNWYRDDLFSMKMKSLLYSHLETEPNDLIKHMLCLLIINKRPAGWEKTTEEYIIEKHKNSFFLYDIYTTLKAEYEYAQASNSTFRKIEYLIKKTGAKHQFGSKNPSKKLIGKVLDTILPNRQDSEK